MRKVSVQAQAGRKGHGARGLVVACYGGVQGISTGLP